jgi:4-hydroxy-3-methylbut-2-en-1-yl diphosphate synthase IspG/GcpE
LSCKVSGVQDLISVYRNWPNARGVTLLGLTEEWAQRNSRFCHGPVNFDAGGIGDTFAFHAHAQPWEARTQEVVVASEIIRHWVCAQLCAQQRSRRRLWRTIQHHVQIGQTRSMISFAHKCHGANQYQVWKA